MDTTRVASTTLLGLSPLGSAGDRAYPRLIEILGTRLGPDHAFLLAEPVPHPDGTKIDWYVPGDRRAISVQTLPAETQAHVLQQMQHLQQDVLQLAATLERSGSSGQALAQSLRNAMTVPGPDKVYAVPVEGMAGIIYRPVLIAWAHRTAGTLDVGGGLKGDTAAPIPIQAATTAVAALSEARNDIPARDGPAAQPPARLFRWHLLLLWLLFALLVALLIWRFLPACRLAEFRIFGFAGWNYCRVVPPVREAALDETPRLNALIADLEDQLARRRNDCEIAELQRPPPPPAPSPSPPPKNEAVKRLEENGRTPGKLSFILTWSGYSDLDLSVKCPISLSEINFRNRTDCGGEFIGLDKNNGNTQNKTSEPIENIDWSTDAPRGSYVIGVRFYERREERQGSVSYVVTVVEDGNRVVDTFPGTFVVSQSGSRPTFRHTYTR